MRALPLVLVTVIGCAQVAGLDEASGRDAATDGASDGMRDGAASADARVCAGGDARASDPATGACYMYFTTPQPRDAARATCAALDAGVVLASIQSANENALIAGLIGANLAFLGGNDEVAEGTFRWEDGSAVVLTNWNLNEPNNGLGMYEEDCIVMSGADAGKWDDRPCNATGLLVPGMYGFVCERD
jgi:hypothetical protein